MGKRSSSQLQWFVGSFLLPAFFAGCGGGTTPTPPAVGVQVQLSPTSKSLLIGESATFTATVTGTDNKVCTWSVQEGASGGAVTGQGVYTAPGTAGTYHVKATSVADASKYATATVTVSPAPEGGVTVKGVVLDAITGKGIPLAEVTVVSMNPASASRAAGTRAQTTTEGRYELKGVQPGTAKLQVKLPDGSYQAAEIVLTVHGSDASVDLDVTLVPLGLHPQLQLSAPSEDLYETSLPYQFRYEVTPADIKPCFSMTTDSALPVATINKDGVFRPHAPGTVTVHAYAGTATQSVEVVVKPWYGTISGKVTDKASGAPIIGATVSTSDNKWQASDAFGAYAFTGLEPYTYNFTARHDKLYDPASQTVTVSPGEAVTRNFSLSPKPKPSDPEPEPDKGDASGMVIDAATGQPLFAASVAIEGHGSDQTGNDGKFLITGIPTGDQTLSVTKVGYAAVTKALEIVKDARTNAGTLYLVPLGSVPNKPSL